MLPLLALLLVVLILCTRVGRWLAVWVLLLVGASASILVAFWLMALLRGTR